MTYQDIKNNDEINTYIRQADQSLPDTSMISVIMTKGQEYRSVNWLLLFSCGYYMNFTRD